MQRVFMPSTRIILLALLILSSPAARAAETDPYEQYVKTSKDFQRVKQDKDWCLKAFPSWTYMPWTYQWNIGYDDDSGQWSTSHGYNGAFIDRDGVGAAGSPTGRLDWIDKYKLRFYVDHLAAKRYLHLWDGNEMRSHANSVHGTGVRTPPVNEAMRTTLDAFIARHIGAVKSSPNRGAYALDDEISWGHFVHPTMWQVTDDAAAYPKWLAEVYGPNAPHHDRWISYNEIQPKLRSWTIGTFDASPLMDEWTFNDSYWNNFLGDLVEYSNTIDPQTPCGFVGGQCPNAFGGYDYAKVMRKVQYLEAYNIGSSQSIIRSFNPHNGIPTVTSHFHKSVDDTIWQTWYYLAHGNRGFIGWVDGWFDGKTPRPWHDEVAPTYHEANDRIGPLMSGAEWKHDGVAIYYSHPSIQLGWILDAEAHGKTWTNRNGDDRLGASHQVRHAWENMLRDAGLQYDFLSYADVIQSGIPSDYRVLILPACLCLSDVEARRIQEFCRNGGTVVADYLPGVWDQHGKGRSGGGVLDEMFDVHHDPSMGSADLFGGTLWCEVNQDANFNWKTYEQFLTNQNTCIKDASGYHKVVQKMPAVHTNHFGKGTAFLMNLSPQWYNAYRAQGAEAAKSHRATFIDPVVAGGPRRWVELSGDAADAVHGYEITYWQKEGRTILFVCLNPELSVNSTGGGNAVGLKSGTIPVTLSFTSPVKHVRDERTGKSLFDGASFKVDWARPQAIVVSFER